MVLDTNVLLDWMVFRDPGIEKLVQRLESGRLCWVATRAMQVEFERVLDYPAVTRCAPDRKAAQGLWARHARFREDALPAIPLHCGDPDDQMFIDLALACRARWLLTKDRELLKLARRARAFGIEVLPPARWAD